MANINLTTGRMVNSGRGIDRTDQKKPKHKVTTTGNMNKNTPEWNAAYDKKMALHKKQVKAKKAFDALPDKDKKFFSE
jgi:hypothetical protein